jgi:hypothetical protein
LDESPNLDDLLDLELHELIEELLLEDELLIDEDELTLEDDELTLEDELSLGHNV